MGASGAPSTAARDAVSALRFGVVGRSGARHQRSMLLRMRESVRVVCAVGQSCFADGLRGLRFESINAASSASETVAAHVEEEVDDRSTRRGRFPREPFQRFVDQ
jgi:hypothetical protein